MFILYAQYISQIWSNNFQLNVCARMCVFCVRVSNVIRFEIAGWNRAIYNKRQQCPHQCTFPCIETIKYLLLSKNGFWSRVIFNCLKSLCHIYTHTHNDEINSKRLEML